MCISEPIEAFRSSMKLQDEAVWEDGLDASVSDLGSRRVARYQSLAGDDFRHPLDQQNTSMLRGLPGLELIAKNLMGPVAEQVLLLENIGTSVKIGPQQLSR